MHSNTGLNRPFPISAFSIQTKSNMGSNCFKPQQHSATVTPKPPTPRTGRDHYLIRWKRGDLIGQGAYGQVYECLDIDSGQLYALKHIALSGQQEKIQKAVTNLKREITNLRGLNHKNIVRYIQAEIAENHSGVDIILEFVPGGSLRQLLNKFSCFGEPIARKYVKQLLEGLDYLHGLGIIHRDLKCANLLSCTDGSIKITDFGASKRLVNSQVNEDYEVCKSLKGSPYWMAPEVARRSGHSYPADIWSVGCTLIEILTGKPPWSDVSTNVREVLAIIGAAVKPPKYPAGLTKECYSFLDNCLQIDTEARATAEQLLQHSFITGVAAPSGELQSLLRNTTITNHILPTLSNDLEDREEVHIIVPRISLTTKFHSPIVHQVAEELKEEMKTQGKAYREQFSTNAI